MNLDFFFKSNKNKFLFMDKENIHIGVGIKKIVPIELLEENATFAFIMTHFYNTDSKLWKNFTPGAYFPEEYIKLSKKNLVSKKSDVSYSYEVFQENIDAYQIIFDRVMDAVLSGECDKVVLSRLVECKLDKKVDYETLFYRAIENNKTSYIFFYFMNDQCFFGATPELLVKKKGNEVEIDALAGTMKNKIENYEKLLHCNKNREEHQIVVDEISEVIKEMGYECKISETTTLPLKNLIHLHTKIQATSNASIINFLKMLHPTPALGGRPQKAALKVIKRVENYQRGCYGAPIGYFEKGSGLFAVGIRSALSEDNKLTCFAGGGIVRKSNYLDEYKESENKLKTILELLKP
ncbi:MAG: isochorismate synthase [Fusobacteria bacterium]|nr:isochorismate synthase [Fusobacteriota bacterium]